jgi:hypothetical protein
MANAKSKAAEKHAEWYRHCNWTKPEEYPSPKTASLDRWAWEFLRRNKQFESDLASLSAMAKKHPWRQGKGYELGKHPLNILHNKINERWQIDIWYLNQWIDEAPGDYDAPCSFATGKADHVWNAYKFPEHPDTRFHVVEEKDGAFLYRINLHWPISPQVAAIKRHAVANQQCWKQNHRPKPITSKKMHVKKFPYYLRVFDAVSDGEKVSKIANVFSMEKARLDGGTDYEKGVNNAYEAALRFINNEEYLFIPMSTKAK